MGNDEKEKPGESAIEPSECFEGNEKGLEGVEV